MVKTTGSQGSSSSAPKTITEAITNYANNSNKNNTAKALARSKKSKKTSYISFYHSKLLKNLI